VDRRPAGRRNRIELLGSPELPVAVKVVQNDIPISDRQYSVLQSAFLLAYSVMYAGGGRIVDRLGTRGGYTAIALWWSAANFLHGIASSVLGLGVHRFLLGLGEGGEGSFEVSHDLPFPVPGRGTIAKLSNEPHAKREFCPVSMPIAAFQAEFCCLAKTDGFCATELSPQRNTNRSSNLLAEIATSLRACMAPCCCRRACGTADYFA
jgi:hypothetical protein